MSFLSDIYTSFGGGGNRWYHSIFSGHEPEARGGGDREEGVQRAAPEGEPDRLHHGVHRGGQDEPGPGLGRHGVAPVAGAERWIFEYFATRAEVSTSVQKGKEASIY